MPPYSDVTVADVHNALAFVFDNPALLRDQETAKEEAIERIRKQRPVDPEEFKPQI